MKTTPVTIEDIQRSVISVPPLCRNDDLSLNRQANIDLIRHLERGGVTTFMYGGNANFYHVSMGEYPEILDMLADAVGAESWVIPSVGPDYGKMMDQAKVLADRAFPTAMVLPLLFPKSPAGVDAGIRRFADAFGRPVIAYIKAEGYLEPAQVARLVDDKIVCAIKYALVRDDPADDPYLEELCKLVDRNVIISGIGERPVITHWEAFGLRAFTSGSVCVAPRSSSRILDALKNGDGEMAASLRESFLPLEDIRDERSPLCVLHRAVGLAGIAETGPLTPLLSDVVEGESKAALAQVAQELLATDTRLARAGIHLDMR